MRIRATLRWIAFAVLVLCASGSATAQQGGGDTGAKAQVGFERRPQLSTQEELAQAEAILKRIDAAARGVRRQLETARAARDVVKTLCLNDKLSQVDVANRSARDRQTALQSAVQRNDVELANHEFTIMTVLRQRIEQLVAEANQCIGQDMAFIGQTEIVTTIDPNLADPDRFPPSQDTIPPTPPLPATPSQ